jgi:copper chaperone CopZ
MTTTTYGVTGMTCGHCISAVQQEVSALPGVQDVAVELVIDGSSTVRVTSESNLDEAEVRAAVQEAGYELEAQ